MSSVPRSTSAPENSSDQAAEAVRERDASRVDADERDRVEVGVRLDDLVGDAVKGALERFCVEELPGSGSLGSCQSDLLSGLTGPG